MAVNRPCRQWAVAVRYGRYLAGAGLLILIFGSSADPLEAQTRVCLRLQAQLAALATVAGADDLFERYDAAVGQQREELVAARQRARGMGCGFSLGVGSRDCQAINLKIERMELNLEDLQRSRNVLAKGDSGGGDSERQRLLAALDANGCAEDRRAERSLELGRDQDGNLFDRIRGDEDAYLAPWDPFDENVVVVPGAEDAFPAYRTMCVRTCDGYYFPMSPSSSRIDFARDQQNCESICPGTEMRTYYQRSEIDDVDSMMSTITDEPYSDLGTAYLYRRGDTARRQGCGCGEATTDRNYTIIGGDRPPEAARRSSAEIGRPSARPDSAADPETLANKEGGLDTKQIKELLKPKATKSLPAGERRVRVVGPKFLPDRSEAAGPPVPDPTQAR